MCLTGIPYTSLWVTTRWKLQLSVVKHIRNKEETNFYRSGLYEG
jgi:hypothetical protein